MSSTDGLPMPRRLGAILAIALGITMAVLDGMIANVALPTIADDLGTSPANSIWVVNAYQLTITMTLLSLSSLGDLWSYRKVYLIGLGLFSLTSGLCALSDSLATLTGARVLQGLGAAALMSVNGALLRLIYPKRMLGRGIGINTLVVAVSTAAGPTVAAGILSVANWPWLFAVNLPIGLAALVMGFRFLPHNDGAKEQRFDKASALLNALTFGLFFAAFSGFAQGQPLWLTALELAATLVAGHFFVRRQLHQAYPLLPVDLLRIPIFSLSICTSICSFWAQMLAMVSIPFYFQKTLGLSEIETGLLMTPWPLATMVMAPIAGRLVERFHGGMLGAIGLGVFALGLLLLALLPAAPSHLEIVLRMLVCGAGFGLFQSPNNHTILSSAPRQRSGGASGMLSTARLIGQTSGAAMVALLFNLFGGNGTHAALIGAALFAAVAALVSALRLTQPRVQ
ncbi:MFS transporter [Gallaecimonas pentaromativorans]|uniref:DHA2 family multidrug resistance protein-like MFS transporter n=1 Tax=Gallaecimonas pentaromativorans TaxID=584787 RepID=A0A3N1PP09_9GAMM|nr:MFS transporter [Gallaecimonas pentaromativorans]ROQ28861.1 DHA2 family multidrug resistance protein-like MFS transporter [Gallaecimonas pentaromativorans]